MRDKLSRNVRPGQLWNNLRSGRNEFALVVTVTGPVGDKKCRVLHYDERGNLTVLDTQRTDIVTWKKAGWGIVSRLRPLRELRP